MPRTCLIVLFVYKLFRELNSTFGHLTRQIDITKSELQTELDLLREKISRLDGAANMAHILK